MALRKIFLLLSASALMAFHPGDGKKITVVIDAGHGGNDHGATHETLTEKEITAQICDKIKALNQNENIDLVFTRIDDKSMTLAERADFINQIKPDVVVSIHVNYNKNVTTSGFEIYTSKADNANREKSVALATQLAGKLSENLNAKNRGIKEAPFFILNKSEAPAMVVELGFLSNASDREYLTAGTGQEKIAQSVLDFLQELQ